MEKDKINDLLATQATTTMTLSDNANITKKLINLTSSANHASILFATDEWFATAENLLNPAPPIFVPDLFCEQGKVMDGWETRRRRTAGHDWCVIKLGSSIMEDVDSSSMIMESRSFMISMIELDTAYFTGNQTPRVSIEAMKVTRPSTSTNKNDDDDQENEDYLYNWMPGASTRLARGMGGKGIRGTGQSPAVVQRALKACNSVARTSVPNNINGEWITILPMTTLQPGYEDSRYHTFEMLDEAKKRIEALGGVTHLKLNYYPDGGVARLKVHGYPCHYSEERNNAISDTTSSTDNDISNNTPTVHPHSSPNPPPSSQPHPHPELSSNLHGGLGLACSNKHYGVPSNLLRPHPGKDMGDGWETARHPDRPAVIAKDPMTGLQDTELMDWSVVKLGFGGAQVNEGISRIIVDTRHFKGNFPESVTIDACHANPAENVSDDEVCKSAAGKEKDTGDGGKLSKSQSGNIEWFPLLKRTLLTADAEHEFLREHGHNIVNGRRGVTHLRISITPDGGLSRVRIYGSPSTGGSVENVPRSHL